MAPAPASKRSKRDASTDSDCPRRHVRAKRPRYKGWGTENGSGAILSLVMDSDENKYTDFLVLYYKAFKAYTLKTYRQHLKKL